MHQFVLTLAAAGFILIVAAQIPDEIKKAMRGFARVVAVSVLVAVVASQIHTETKIATGLLLAVIAIAWRAAEDKADDAGVLVLAGLLAFVTFMAGVSGV